MSERDNIIKQIRSVERNIEMTMDRIATERDEELMFHLRELRDALARLREEHENVNP